MDGSEDLPILEEMVMEKIKNIPFVKKVGFNRIALVLVLILMYFLFSLGAKRMLGASAIMNALNMTDYLGFLALGVTFVIATGGIDFSIGPVMFCSGLIAGRLMVVNNWPVLLCLFVCVIIGAIFGTCAGFLVAYMELPSFISSMALMNVAKGVGSVYTHVQSSTWPQSTEPRGWYKNLISFHGFPTGLVFLLIVAVICAIILNNTRAGRYILCIGSNREAVRLSGVNTKKWEMLAYVICGTLAGMAAITYAGVNTSFQPGLGDEFNNNAIASCVMGGTSRSGGVASISGSIIGVLIISLLRVGIQSWRLGTKLSPDYQYIITGIIVALAVYTDVRSSKRRK